MMTIKLPSYDRIVYVWLNDQLEVTGFNFHQGVDQEYPEFQKPDQELYDIFLPKYLNSTTQNQMDIIIESIEVQIEREFLKEDILALVRNAKYLEAIDSYIKDRELDKQDLECIMSGDELLQTLINDIIK